MSRKYIEQLFGLPLFRRFVLSFCIALVFLLTIRSEGIAFKDESGEYALKAGFLYNFTQFVRWPEETASLSDTFYTPFDFSLCVVGRDPFGNLLEVLADNLKAQGRPMNIIRLGMDDPWYECHILFVPKDENRNMEKILKKVASSPVLVIGESSSQGDLKPGISFLIKNDTIQFTINKDAIKRSRLRVDSELLDIALEVN